MEKNSPKETDVRISSIVADKVCMKDCNVIKFPKLEDHESLKVENQLKFYSNEPDVSLRTKITMAFICDIFLISIINIGVSVAFVSFINEFLIPLNFTQKMNLSSFDLITSFSIYFTLFSGYFLFFPIVLEGRTPGKIWMKLSVVSNEFKNNINITDATLETSHIVKRASGYMSYYLSFGVTYFMSLFDKEQKSIADHLSETQVVSQFWLEKQLYFRALQEEQIEIEIDSLDIKIAS